MWRLREVVASPLGVADAEDRAFRRRSEKKPFMNRVAPLPVSTSLALPQAVRPADDFDDAQKNRRELGRALD